MFNTIKNLAYERLKTLTEIVKERPKATIAISVSFILLMAVRNYQRRLIYFPVIQGLPKSPSKNPYPYQHPSQQQIIADQIEIKTKDGLILRGWYMKAQKPQRILVYFHQNAGNIGTRLPFCNQIIKRTNSNVLLVAYRGYSDSEGTPTEKGLKKDSIQILDQAIKLGQKDNMPIVVFGRSLGGAAALHACTQQNLSSKIKGIILQNTFTSIHDVVTNIFPKPLLILVKIILWLVLTNRWNSMKLMPKVRKPVLFIKSVRDQLIPKAQMDKLQDLCEVRHFQYLIPLGTHNESWTKDPTLYFKELNQFLSRL